MPNSVAAVAGATVNPTAINSLQGYGIPVVNTQDNSNLDKDAFLKLLVAQLKFQDPMEPTSNEQFIATSAQFTMVEKLDELAAQGTAQATVTSMNTASALVGRNITVVGADGLRQTLHVNEAQLVSGNVRLITDQGAVALDQIVGIGPMSPTQS